MNEETQNANAESIGQNFEEKASSQIGKYKGMVDGWVDKCLGLVGDHPWEKWIGVANGYIDKFLPARVALAGILAFLASVIFAIREDARFSEVIGTIWILVGTVFAMHLAPKALSLMRSFVEKGEAELIRPELAYILKVILALGGLVLAIRSFFFFTSDGVQLGLVSLAIAILATIVFSRPEFVGMKYGYPTNCVEEAISLLLLPVKIVFTLSTLLIGVGIVGGLGYGIYLWIDLGGLVASGALSVVAFAPVLFPLVAYVVYLTLVFFLDLYRAISSVPRKLDDVRKAIESK